MYIIQNDDRNIVTLYVGYDDKHIVMSIVQNDDRHVIVYFIQYENKYIITHIA